MTAERDPKLPRTPQPEWETPNDWAAWDDESFDVSLFTLLKTVPERANLIRNILMYIITETRATPDTDHLIELINDYTKEITGP